MSEETSKRHKSSRISSSGAGKHYSGYTLENGQQSIDTVLIGDLDKKKFQEEYVFKRKPCLIRGIIPNFDPDSFKLDNLADTLDFHDVLQVERKVDGGYGSGENREKMTLQDFLERLRQGDDSLYLTTQYEEDDVDCQDNPDDSQEDDDHSASDSESIDSNDAADSASEIGSIDLENLKDDFEEFDSEGDFDQNDDDPVISDACVGGVLTEEEGFQRLKELLQKPLTNLHKKWSWSTLCPEILDVLIPQQINLWMGCSRKSSSGVTVSDTKNNLGLGRAIPTKNATSSGLHHDHADNLYIPISGHKRFTLFSPDRASNLYTVGTVNEVFNSGIIDYNRDDNAPGWRHIRSDGALLEEVARWELASKEDDLTPERRRQLEHIISQESQVMADVAERGSVQKDPPSFSRIPPALLHMDEVEDPIAKKKMQQLLADNFKSLQSLPNVMVSVRPGDMLYLPAGWFHEVTSFGDESNGAHIALNYWYVPPNGHSREQPYSDNYWTDDFERTKLALDYFKTHD